MTIYTQTRVRQSLLEEYMAPMGDVLGATAEEAIQFSPLSSVVRERELKRAERGAEPNVLDYKLWGEQDPSTSSPMMDAETARSKIKEQGLDLVVPDDGIRERALDILIERKREERKRQDVLNRAPSGVLPGAARLGTAFAASLLDPFNIAAGFVPVVGQARYMTMLGKAGGALGRAGVRARIGALEGSVGAAAFEPLIYGVAQSEQSDYDLVDSMLNIGLGTAIGGGLHVGVGAAAEAIARGQDWRTARATEPLPRMLEEVGFETREAALRTGVAQAMSGRQVDVEPIITYSANQNRAFQEQPLRAAVGQDFQEITTRVDEVTGVEGITLYHGSPHEFDRFSRAHIGKGEGAQAYGHGLYFAESAGVARSYQESLAGRFQYGEQKPSDSAHVSAAKDFMEHGYNADDTLSGLKKAYPGASEDELRIAMRAADPGRLYEVRVKADPEEFLDWDKPLREQSARVQAALRRQMGEGFDRFADKTGGDYVQYGLGNTHASDLMEAGIPGIRYLDQGSRAQGEGSRNYVVFDDSLITTVRRNDQSLIREPTDLRAKAQASFQPEAVRLADFQAAMRADEQLKAAPADDAMPQLTLDEVMEDVTALAQALDDPDVLARELGEFDELAETADAYGKAVRAAGLCQVRRGS